MDKLVRMMKTVMHAVDTKKGAALLKTGKIVFDISDKPMVVATDSVRLSIACTDARSVVHGYAKPNFTHYIDWAKNGAMAKACKTDEQLATFLEPGDEDTMSFFGRAIKIATEGNAVNAGRYAVCSKLMSDFMSAVNKESKNCLVEVTGFDRKPIILAARMSDFDAVGVIMSIHHKDERGWALDE